MNHDMVIMQHFSKFKYISSMQAFDLYGITRLSATIYSLRKRGIKIGSVWRTTINRYGKEIRYMDYYLEKRGKLWKRKPKLQQ